MAGAETVLGIAVFPVVAVLAVQARLGVVREAAGVVREPAARAGRPAWEPPGAAGAVAAEVGVGE